MTLPDRRIRVAIAQDEVTPDLASGLVRTDQRAAEAARAGAALVAFPETWLPGYPAWLDVCRDAGLWDHPPVKAAYRRMAEESVVVNGASGHELAAIARRNRIAMVVGVVERVQHGPAHGTLFNTLLTFGPDGALLNHHRKLVPTYTERLVWGPGDADGLRAVDVPVDSGVVRVGGLVCWEHWMPLARQALHDAGEDIHVAAWPTVKDMLQIASRHYAFEGRCFVLAAGSLMRADALPRELEPHPDIVRSTEQLVLRGGSAIIGPDGRYVHDPVADQPALLIADLELGLAREESMTLDVTGHYSRPDVFTFDVRTGTRRSSG
ncbi:MAG TPA: carbon-nitrogen hydrolase family protein [Gemmatimonadaceae bacterium]|jgi:predicted amidohydrolase|nr:carbon-nitrogen hydrolase family protein [Gemmatimonadaceae bacterium]